MRGLAMPALFALALVVPAQARTQDSRAVSAPLPPPRPVELQAPQHPPQRPPQARPEPNAAQPPERDSSPDALSASGCVAALASVHGDHVHATRAEPGQDAACAVVEPVLVKAMTLGAGADRRRVDFQPPVTLSCAMAGSVAQWLETSVAPLAKGYFTRDLTALRVGGGHECRRRNRAANGPLSEHATGRALDIFAFVVDDGRDGGNVVVKQPDGTRQRDFLSAVRQSACGAFMTALGPGSDAAHSDHLHVDTQPRRAASSRFCQ